MYRKQTYNLSLHSDFEGRDSFEDDGPDSELAPLERRFVTRNLTGKSIISVIIVLAVLAICIGLGITAKGSVLKTTPVNNSQSIPALPVDLHIVCSPMNLHTDRGYQNCLDLCQPAQCCELSPDDDQSCIEGHRHKCKLYRESCKHLEHHNIASHSTGKSAIDSTIVSASWTNNAIMHSIPYEVEMSCSPSNILSVSGIQRCLDVCQHHLCCFDEIEAASCANIDPAECDLYTACQVLVDLPDSSDSPRDTCREDEIEVIGPSLCLHSCSKGYCCLFDARYESSCATDEICSNFYEPCHLLAPQTLPRESSDLLKQVKEGCAEYNLRDEVGLNECRKACDERSCCFDTGAGSCQSSNEKYCAEVADCSFLKDSNERKKQNSNRTVDAALEELKKSCAADNLLTLSGFHDCYDKCFYHSCCFTNNPALSCDSDDACRMYEPCVQLFGGNNSSTLGTACTISSIKSSSGLSKCRKQCSERLCCFQDPNLPSSCISFLGKTECDRYKDCSILVSSSSHRIYNERDNYLVSQIRHFCREKDMDSQYCKSLCIKRNCCFLKGDDNCYSDNQDWCGEISACTNHPNISFPFDTRKNRDDPVLDTLGESGSNSEIQSDNSADFQSSDSGQVIGVDDNSKDSILAAMYGTNDSALDPIDQLDFFENYSEEQGSGADHNDLSLNDEMNDLTMDPIDQLDFFKGEYNEQDNNADLNSLPSNHETNGLILDPTVEVDLDFFGGDIGFGSEGSDDERNNL